jgi:hypothetical protein
MLAATKYWLRQNIVGVDKTLVSTKHWRQQNLGIDKILVLPNFGVDKILALTKHWR